MIEDGKPCGKRIFSYGWCQKHYYRWYRHGDPTVVLDKNGTPRKPNLGYSAIHKRLVKERGKASAQRCVGSCGGKQAQEWSYKGGGGGLPYSTNLDDYEPRCSSCHVKFDGKWPEKCELVDDDGKPCGEPHHCRGMCQRHYDAKRRKRVAKRNTSPRNEGEE